MPATPYIAFFKQVRETKNYLVYEDTDGGINKLYLPKDFNHKSLRVEITPAGGDS